MSSKGGMFVGPRHKDGGIPVTVKSTGQKIEVEGGESILSVKTMQDPKEYKLKGTPKEIASKLNEINGGNKFSDTEAEIERLRLGGLIKENTWNIFEILYLI